MLKLCVISSAPLTLTEKAVTFHRCFTTNQWGWFLSSQVSHVILVVTPFLNYFTVAQRGTSVSFHFFHCCRQGLPHIISWVPLLFPEIAKHCFKYLTNLIVLSLHPFISSTATHWHGSVSFHIFHCNLLVWICVVPGVLLFYVSWLCFILGTLPLTGVALHWLMFPTTIDEVCSLSFQVSHCCSLW